MKALIVKDILLLKNNIVYIIVALSISISMSFSSPLVVPLAFITYIAAIMATSTIAYDSYDNSLVHLLTLPITKKTYVKEKYLLVISLVSISYIVIGIISLVFADGALLGDLSLAALIPATVIIWTAFILPFRFKYDDSKAMIAIIIITIIVIFIISRVVMFIDPDMMITLNRAQYPFYLLAYYILAVIIDCISYLISKKVIDSKEL